VPVRPLLTLFVAPTALHTQTCVLLGVLALNILLMARAEVRSLRSFLLLQISYGFAVYSLDRCFCGHELRPVCAGEITFANACEARCAGYCVNVPGVCTSAPNCPAALPSDTPVCGSDGITYSCASTARCHGVWQYVAGQCNRMRCF
jgi:hypothetical protein